MLNRLNGWQRIGVVLTALWLAYVLLMGVLSYIGLESGDGPFSQIVKGSPPQCTAAAPDLPSDRKAITLEEAYGCAPGALIDGTPDQYRFLWGQFLAATLAPPALGWLFSYLLVGMVRWVAGGFRRKAT